MNIRLIPSTIAVVLPNTVNLAPEIAHPGLGQNARTTVARAFCPQPLLDKLTLLGVKLTVLVILPWLSVLTVSAQQECRVRALCLQAGATATELHAHNEAGTATAGTVQVKTFLNHEYDTLKLKGPKLVFTADPKPASAKAAAARIGAREIPATARSVILLFIPEAPAKPACKVVVVDDCAKAFPPGSIGIVNLSSLPLKIQLEEQSFEFKAGEIRSIQNPPVGANQSSAMKGLVMRDGKWVNFSSGAWPHPGDKRVLQVLTENPVTKQVESRGIRDVAKP